MKSNKLSICLCFLLVSCNIAPDLNIPKMDMPTGSGYSSKGFVSKKWWTVFNIWQLNYLEEKALTRNHDLELAMANIEAAMAIEGTTFADMFPSLNGSMGSSRQRSSKKSKMFFPGFGMEYVTNQTVALSASYELDFFGKYRMMNTAARSDLLATIAARDTVVLSVTCQVAKLYFSVLCLEEQYSRADRVAEICSLKAEKYRDMFKLGYCGEGEYLRARMQARASEAALAAVRQSLKQTMSALELLTGSSPKQIVQDAAMSVASWGAEVPDVIPSGLPSDLLLRRPDIRQAEEGLRSANARIGVARTAYFPSISLTGLFGYDSQKLRDLFTGPATMWDLGASLNMPILNFGRLGANLNAAKANYKKAEAIYKKTVKTAFKEAFDAIVANRESREAFLAKKSKLLDAKKSYEIYKARKAEGAISGLDLMDAEMALISEEVDFIKAKYARIAAIADLAKVLGGGWAGQQR